MDIYVKSRGQSRDADYEWLKVTDSIEYSLVLPHSIADLITFEKIRNLIDLEDKSVLLLRATKKLLLLVTGLESRNRKDVLDRSILSSVAWIGEIADEPSIRAIAVLALRQQLLEKVDQAIEFDGENSFKVSTEKIQDVAISAQLNLGNTLPKITQLKGKNIEKLQKSLASELEQCYLPEIEGSLVVVTGNKDKIDENFEVWRVLSNFIEEEEWTPISRGKLALSEFIKQKNFSISSLQLTYRTRMLPLIGTILCFCLVLVFLAFNKFDGYLGKQKQAIERLESTSARIEKIANEFQRKIQLIEQQEGKEFEVAKDTVASDLEKLTGDFLRMKSSAGRFQSKLQDLNSEFGAKLVDLKAELNKN